MPPLLTRPAGKSLLPALPQLTVGLPGRSLLPGSAGGSGGGLAVPIPRLDLSQSAHSTLETRNASAEMQLAADTEQAKARQGRGALGELERGALGKGKVQAAAVMRKMNSALSGAGMGRVLVSPVAADFESVPRMLRRCDACSLHFLPAAAACAAPAQRPASAPPTADSAYCRALPTLVPSTSLRVVLCAGAGGPADLSAATAGEVSYSEERGRRLLYRDEGLHLEVLQLVFTLIFTEDGQLDRTYCDQYPWERKLQVC